MNEPFFSPKGIAVIGASQDEHKLGFGVIRNLLKYRYKGNIYPVNRQAYDILEIPCYRTVDATPDPVDLAIIIVPAKAVAKVLKECGERGILHAIIVTGGFSETGSEGVEMENELKAIADSYKMKVIGPNCIGTIDTHTPVNTTFVVGMPEPGDIGFISHSGAMVAAIIDWASGSGIGFSRIVSLGNQLDVNETDMIEAISEDPQTKVITAYIEGVSDGMAFMEKAKKAAINTPFLVLKGGQGESGAKAVASHTGALAGSTNAFKAAFRRSGIQEAATIEEMFEWARAMAWQPLPEGNRVAVLTNAGGPAILAIDALEKAGLEIAQLSDTTKEYLKKRLPKAASVNNPVDVLAGSGPATYTLALEAILEDEGVDAVVVIQAPQDWFLPVSLAEVVGEVSAAHSKTVITSLMGKASIGDALKVLQNRRVPNVAFPERSASVLAAMLERKRWLERLAEPHEPELDQYKEAAEKYVSEEQWDELISSYGIQIPHQEIVHTVEEAISVANGVNGAVAMKLQTKEVSHKSDIGGVLLNVKDSSEVKRNWNKLKSLAEEKSLTFQGVMIQEMIADGPEMIIGMVRDEHFGPLVLFGYGGTDVELLKDVEMAVAPLNRSEALRLITSTKAGRKLEGWRNFGPSDKEAVIDALIRMGQIGLDFPQIKELEINPLCVMEKGIGAYALDIRGTCESKGLV